MKLSSETGRTLVNQTEDHWKKNPTVSKVQFYKDLKILADSPDVPVQDKVPAIENVGDYS